MRASYLYTITFFGVIFLLVLVSCGVKSPSNTASSNNVTPGGYKLVNGLPEWVINPNIDGYTGAVGVVDIYGDQPTPDEESIAQRKATAELSRTIRVEAKSTLETEKTESSSQNSTDTKSSVETSVTSKHSSQEGFKTQKKDYYIVDGKYHVWLVIE